LSIVSHVSPILSLVSEYGGGICSNFMRLALAVVKITVHRPRPIINVGGSR